jgi:PD-(D/E)XK nuclease superfamily
MGRTFAGQSRWLAGGLMTYSYTQLSQYLTCPRRYRHRYLDGWKERDSRAAMLFGRAFEQALGAYFRREDPGDVLFREWSACKDQNLHFSNHDTWDRMALDPQLVCYSWMTGISEVAQVVFVRKRLVELQYLPVPSCRLYPRRRRVSRFWTTSDTSLHQFPTKSSRQAPHAIMAFHSSRTRLLNTVPLLLLTRPDTRINLSLLV